MKMKTHARSLVKVLSHRIGTENVRLGTEVGVWRGELSADLLRSFPNLFLFMVDLWQPFDGSAMQHKDNSVEVMLAAMENARQNTEFAAYRRRLFASGSVEQAEHWTDHSMDFVFLDADHFYESVRADLHAWWPKVHPSGVLAGHDYNGRGDRRKGWGVKQAVDEFFEPLKLVVCLEPGRVWWVTKGIK